MVEQDEGFFNEPEKLNKSSMKNSLLNTLETDGAAELTASGQPEQVLVEAYDDSEGTGGPAAGSIKTCFVVSYCLTLAIGMTQFGFALGSWNTLQATF